MPDENGLTLQPGDPVMIQDGHDGVPATILREMGESRYLIQLDVPSLSRAEYSMRLRALGIPGVSSDTQEPFQVSGSQLVFMGDFDED